MFFFITKLMSAPLREGVCCSSESTTVKGISVSRVRPDSHGVIIIILITTNPGSHIYFSVIVIIIVIRNENFSISYKFVMITIMIMTPCEPGVRANEIVYYL